MRHKIIFILCFFLTQFSFGQKNEIWVRFYDTTTELSGYKNLNGNIKIPARFDNFTRADTFYNIIAVTEKVDSSYRSYYLLKDGRKVGHDSVFTFDYTYDCESEGKILFKDSKKDRVGFFDTSGTAVIPAIYNAASPFHNGVALVLKNAKRKCWGENEDTLNCEHLGWSGGETILINHKNEILIDSLKADFNNINWYSLKINAPDIDTSIWLSIKGTDGNIYSFLNYEREFTKWFYLKFLLSLKDPNSGKLKELLFPEITFWSDKDGWTSVRNNIFLKSFATSITSERFQETTFKKISISDEGLNPFIFKDNQYNIFNNACGLHNKEKYPVFDVMLTYSKPQMKELKSTQSPVTTSGKWEPSDFDKKYEIDFQEHFEFIRTQEGYKLLSVSLKH